MNDYGFGGIDGRDMVIRELEDRGAAYRQRIADLEAQVGRLQRYISLKTSDNPDPMQFAQALDDCEKYGDLDPVKGQGHEHDR